MLKMGIIGAGGIAGTMAGTISKMDDVERTAIAARDLDRAQAFAEEYGFKRAYGSYDELLADPDIIGVKHTSLNLYALERMHDAYPEKVLFNGFDEQFIGAYQMGATAAIGTTVNLFAPLFLEARKLLLAGDNEGAHRVQKQINERVELMVSVGIFNAAKYLWTLRGVPCGNCRRPFGPLTEQQRKILEEAAQRWA